MTSRQARLRAKRLSKKLQCLLQESEVLIDEINISCDNLTYYQLRKGVQDDLYSIVDKIESAQIDVSSAQMTLDNI